MSRQGRWTRSGLSALLASLIISALRGLHAFALLALFLRVSISGVRPVSPAALVACVASRARRFVVVVIALSCGSAFALEACQSEWRAYVSGKSGYLVVQGNALEQLTAACAWGGGIYNVAAGPPTYFVNSAGAGESKCGRWSGSTFSVSGTGVSARQEWLKPDGTWSTTNPGNVCQAPSQCAANKGKTTIINWTIGFTRSPDGDDTRIVGAVNPWPSVGEVCNAGCMSSGDPYNENSQAFKSQVPTAQGLYRLSMDIPVTNSGDTCTAGTKDQAISPAAPEPQCPGYVGEVNGKLGCYGTAAQPVNSVPSSTPPKPPIAGNPAAGAKAATGEGSGQGSSGRTPAAGSGGNAGGPTAAGVGGKGGGAGGTAAGTGATTGQGNTSGSVAKGPEGTEQAACGAPGQPVCAVKVDENGMPQAGDATKVDGLNTQMDKLNTGIEGIQSKDGKDTSWGPLPAWFNNASCSPFDLGTIPVINVRILINICPFKDYVDGAMSFLWVVTTFFMVIAMVGRTTSGSNS